MDVKINIAGFVPNSITDGPGLRFTVFCQGCTHNCPGCHNPQTHPFNTGTDYTPAEIFEKIKKDPLVKKVTFSGGDPFCQSEGFYHLAKILKENNYEVACYTGFLFEELIKDENSFEYKLLENIDILVDGPFKMSEKSLDLKFKGSKNQRTIDVPNSLQQKTAVLSQNPSWV